MTFANNLTSKTKLLGTLPSLIVEEVEVFPQAFKMGNEKKISRSFGNIALAWGGAVN